MIIGEILVHPYYADGITSPMIIGEILVHPYYTDGITSPMINGEILVHPYIQTELPFGSSYISDNIIFCFLMLFSYIENMA